MIPDTPEDLKLAAETDPASSEPVTSDVTGESEMCPDSENNDSLHKWSSGSDFDFDGNDMPLLGFKGFLMGN